MRYVVMARWPTSPDGTDPMTYDEVYKEAKTAGSATGLVQFLLKEIRPYQISVTDRENDGKPNPQATLDGWVPRKAKANP